MTFQFGLNGWGIPGRSRVSLQASEANDKLIHRWGLFEDSGPFSDRAGGADGTNNGTTQVVGDWVGGAARQGNGTDAYIETTPLGGFGSSLSSNFAVGFSFQYSASGGEDFLGVFDGNMAIEVGDDIFGSPGNVELFLRDNDGDTISRYTDATFDDGSEHRCVLNKTGNTASDIEIWIDQSEVTTTTTGSDQAFDNTVDFTIPLYLLASNFDGAVNKPYSGILDDVCIFEDSLTSTEIQSYQNPWV